MPKKKSLDKKQAAMILFILIIVGIVCLIYALKNNGNEINEETIKCIAQKAKLFTSRTCGHCANQKQILGEYLEYFSDIDCMTNREKCQEFGINAVPTWIINGQQYNGVHTLEQLKLLTGC